MIRTLQRTAGVALLCLPLAVYAVPMRPAEKPVQEPAATEAPDPAHLELMRFLLGSPDEPNLLRGARVAILATDGVDGFNLEVPRRYLTERGAQVDVIVPRAAFERTAPAGARRILTMNPSGEEVEVGFDRYVDEVDPLAYHAVYLPGNRKAVPALDGADSVAFIGKAVHAGRPVFAIGNAPLVLLNAGLLEHRRATGDATIFMRLALSNAAATDAALVKDGSIHTSRDAFDIPVLMRQLIGELLKRAPQ